MLAHGTLHETRMGPGGSDMTYFEEQVTGTYHIGCHVDGLGHVGINGHFYNGNHYKDFYTPKGLTKFGTETMTPWICRGVLLNIAEVVGTEQLQGGHVITPDDLEKACANQGVEVRPGDVVLLHTGWGVKWDQDIHEYEEVEPGAGWDAAHWLTERRVSLVGADNWAFEVIPFEREEAIFAVHQHLLAEAGTHILENIKTAGAGRERAVGVPVLPHAAEVQGLDRRDGRPGRGGLRWASTTSSRGWHATATCRPRSSRSSRAGWRCSTPPCKRAATAPRCSTSTRR